MGVMSDRTCSSTPYLFSKSFEESELNRLFPPPRSPQSDGRVGVLGRLESFRSAQVAIDHSLNEASGKMRRHHGVH